MPTTYNVIKGDWEDFTNEAYRREQSHWRGIGRWKDDARWQAIGISSLEKINRILAFLGIGPLFWNKRRVFLEWGPGGGANLFAFQRFSKAYYGVDISEKNLAEANRMITKEGFLNYHRILIEDDLSLVSDRIKNEKADIFLSTAVFQHFPSKEYGFKVLEQIAQSVCTNAIGFILIRFDNGNEKYRPIKSLDEYQEMHITATHLRRDMMWRQIDRRPKSRVTAVSH